MCMCSVPSLSSAGRHFINAIMIAVIVMIIICKPHFAFRLRFEMQMMIDDDY